MAHSFPPWLFWAALSAFFAALTAILAKVGVEDVSSDMAMLVRTIVVLLAMTSLLAVTGKMESLAGFGARTWTFLVLSGLCTGASWLCYFRALKLGDAARVAPVDKLSVVLVAILGVAFLGEHLSLKGWAGVVLIGLGVALTAL